MTRRMTMRTTKVATSLLRIGAILLSLAGFPATQAGVVSYLGHGRGTGDYFAPHDPAPNPIAGPATVAVTYRYDPTIVGVPTALGTEYDGLFLEITITIPQGGRDWVWEMDPTYGGSLTIGGGVVGFAVGGFRGKPPNWRTVVELDGELPADRLPTSLDGLAGAAGSFYSEDMYGSRVEGVIFDPPGTAAAVPEPGAWVEMMAGVALVGVAWMIAGWRRDNSDG
jgi:hypothetical protein